MSTQVNGTPSTPTRTLPADVVVIWSGRETYGQRGVIIGPGAIAGTHRVYHGPSGRTLDLHSCEFERRPQPTARTLFA